MKLCPGGGTGRRVGLKIRLGSPPVPVQVWPRAPLLEDSLMESLLVGTNLGRPLDF